MSRVNVRAPAVAGTFYPDDPEELRGLLEQYLNTAPTPSFLPKALIAPHAGYRYSGHVAGTVYNFLKAGREVFKRVIVLGTAHHLSFDGIAACSASHFETPLGLIPVDSDAVEEISSLPFVHILDKAHEGEHSLEVHLPFLQEVLDEFTIVPLAVGPTDPEEVARVLEIFLEDARTIVVISSDLSHFLTDREAREIDQSTADAIEALASGEIDTSMACGAHSIKGVLTYAKNHGYVVKTVRLTNSSEVSGDLSRVVGYGAFVVISPEDAAAVSTV